MNIPTVILMLAAAGVMVFGLQKSKQGVVWGKPLTIAGAIVALLLALSSLFTGGGPSADKAREIAERYREVRGEKLGQYLAEQFDGQSAVFLMPYQSVENDPQMAVFIKALEEQLENNVEITARLVPEPPPEIKKQQEEMRKQMQSMQNDEDADPLPPEGMMYGFEPFNWFTPEQLDEMLKDHLGKADLLIAISQMPMDVFSADFWRSPDAPKVVLTQDPVSEYYGAIKADAVVAAITYKPDANYEQKKPPKGVDEAFAQRYLLVTPENVDELDAEYPKLFNKAK